ncbi:MAG: 2-hydroxycarboxylate transporter family protein [Deltaproteobacteria bacterium]|jgi:Na+/citrate or Na+/malate symporter|nr:2-hydroxycarboxylate transporter family protein [Deltaproteobacteria bacterium]
MNKQQSVLEEPEVSANGKIFGMPYRFFLIFSIVNVCVLYIGRLPTGMIGAFPLMIFLGAVFNLIGDRTPIINTFLGGGPIVIIFCSAALTSFQLIPHYSVVIVQNFMANEGFLDLYVASLSTGAILGMNRELLKRAVLRYLPIILGGVSCALLMCATAGFLTGYGAKKALLFIGVPIMGSGMGTGAIPLSKIYGSGTGIDATIILSILVPAVAMGNVISIIMAGLLNRLGKSIKSLSGNGELMKSGSDQGKKDLELEEKGKSTRKRLDLFQLGSGLFIASTFYGFGVLINNFFPVIHAYAWMMIALATIKLLGKFPENLENCAWQWFQFVMTNLTGVLLVGIGIAYTNLNVVFSVLSINYLILVTVTVTGAIIGTAAIGRLMGFYPIESAITAGLCMSNMGGAGDVAVLATSRRIELMPFAQITTRLGGAFMLMASAFILKIFG